MFCRLIVEHDRQQVMNVMVSKLLVGLEILRGAGLPRIFSIFQ
jgi:hypothetical protein